MTEISEVAQGVLSDIEKIVAHAKIQEEVVRYAADMQREATAFQEGVVTEEEFLEAVRQIDKTYCDRANGIEEAEFTEVTE